MSSKARLAGAAATLLVALAGCASCLALAQGCGAAVSDADGAGDASSTVQATSSSSSDTTSSSDSAGSSSTSTDAPLVELQGTLVFEEGSINSGWYFVPCDGSDRTCLTGNVDEAWLCEGASLRVVGRYIPGDSVGLTDATCGSTDLEVVEVLEAGLCDEATCPGACGDGFLCRSDCSTDGECGVGEKCNRWGLPGAPLSARRCAPIPARAHGEGEPCVRDPQRPWIDDCDGTTFCVDGVCRGECGSDADCSDGQHCAQVCVDTCNPLEPDCPTGTTCRPDREAHGCVGPELEWIVGWPCNSVRCDVGQFCVEAEVYFGCGDVSCCASVCDLGSQDCADGLTCVPQWPEDPELAGLGVCSDG